MVKEETTEKYDLIFNGMPARIQGYFDNLWLIVDSESEIANTDERFELNDYFPGEFSTLLNSLTFEERNNLCYRDGSKLYPNCGRAIFVIQKENCLCKAPAQDLFCDLEVYDNKSTLEINLVLFKQLTLKKWIIPKSGLAIAWIGNEVGSPSDYRNTAYIGFLLLDGKLLKLPVMQINRDLPHGDKRNVLTRKLYRTIIEQVIMTNAIGIRGTNDKGIEVKTPKKAFDYADAKKYSEKLKKIFNEKNDASIAIDDIYIRMKEDNIRDKTLDWLQTDGFIHNRECTWDKVYKRE